MTEIPVPLEAFGFLITLAVFVSGGLVYSLLGYWKAIRRSINGSVPFDLAKLKTGGVLGVMLRTISTIVMWYNGYLAYRGLGTTPPGIYVVRV